MSKKWYPPIGVRLDAVPPYEAEMILKEDMDLPLINQPPIPHEEATMADSSTDQAYDPRYDITQVDEANVRAKDGLRRIPLIIHGQVINSDGETTMGQPIPPVRKQ